MSAFSEMVWSISETLVEVAFVFNSRATEVCRVDVIVSVTDYNHNFRGSIEATFESVVYGSTWGHYVEVPIIGGFSKFYATIEITDIEIEY